MRVLFILFFLIMYPCVGFAQEPQVLGKAPEEKKESSTDIPGLNINTKEGSKEPIYITSDSLSVESEKRVFYYKKNVKVVQADLTLTCDELEGRYNQDNKIEMLIAKKEVQVVKGDKIKAHAQKGVYDAKTQIITLTENPWLEQGTSTLNADVIKVFLNENRSVAEGTVRVKLVNEKVNPTPAASPTTTVTVVPTRK